MKEFERLRYLRDTGERGLVLLTEQLQPGAVVKCEYGTFKVVSCALRRADDMTGVEMRAACISSIKELASIVRNLTGEVAWYESMVWFTWVKRPEDCPTFT